MKRSQFRSRGLVPLLSLVGLAMAGGCTNSSLSDGQGDGDTGGSGLTGTGGAGHHTGTGGSTSGSGDGGAGATGGSSHASGTGPSTGSGGVGGGVMADVEYRVPTAGPGSAPTIVPSGYLLLPANRKKELELAVGAGDSDWLALRKRVDDNLLNRDKYKDSPENRALVYLLTGDSKYGRSAIDWASEIVAAADVRSDSYLGFGNRMRQVALVLNYCEGMLTAAERQVFTQYLDGWTHELWFDNQGSGWGLNDPGNNYHQAFVEGTAYAGYALREAGHASGQKYVDLLHDKLEKPGAVLDYIDAHAVGGDWPEGANYGERTKQRLFGALAVIASMGDGNHFWAHSFFPASVYFAIHQVQPDLLSLHPAGDLARDAAMLVTPADRDYVQTLLPWLPEGEAKSLGAWYLAAVSPAYDQGYGAMTYKNVLFGAGGSATPPSVLPTGYLASGTGWVNWRSSWASDATSVTVSGGHAIEQDHQHLDVGSFVIFRRGWLAADATTYSQDGLTYADSAHNMVHVAGSERRYGSVGGLTRLADDGTMAYAQVDGTDQYRKRVGDSIVTLMDEVTRDMVYVRPGLVFLYDRVDPKDEAQSYEWRLHLPVKPAALSDGYSAAAFGAGITLVPLRAGTESVALDSDLAGGASSAWRIAEGPTGTVSRFLNVVRVADGAAPRVDATHVASDGDMEGAAAGTRVVMFSKNAFGASPKLPFSYSLPTVAGRTHLLANMDAGVSLSLDKSGGMTQVTVSAGSTSPSGAGLVSFTE